MNGHDLQYRRIRAPGEHGRALVEPSWNELVALLTAPPMTAPWHDRDCGGRTLGDLCRQGRAALAEAALHYTSTYRDVSISPAPRAWLLTGHQPELFHPGVWFKNVAVDALARRVDAVGIHVVIDNDLPHSLAIRCPTQQSGGPAVTRCVIDLTSPVSPYEDRPVRDTHLFETFGRRVCQVLAGQIDDPMVEHFWPVAVERVRATGRLGIGLAQARHRWEARWGMNTLEIPLSHVCRLTAVRWFFAFLFSQATELHRHYNAALNDYRRLHGIRGQTHPVSDLASRDDWYEVPFWIWSADAPQRRPLWCRIHSRCVELADHRRFRVCLPIHGTDLSEAVEVLDAVEQKQIRIRPRALITTWTLRLLLSDLFVHGIGGAKYDQLTDEIVERFLGYRPPPFAVVTATILLPLPYPDVSVEELRQLRMELRQLQFHPERFLAEPLDAKVRELVEEKRSWLRPVLPSQRRAQYESIHRINQQLRVYVEEVRRAKEEEYQRLLAAWQTRRLLASREYSFCLFPDDYLMTWLKKLVPFVESSAGTDVSMSSVTHE